MDFFISTKTYIYVVSDPDKDDVRCRWAIHDRDECGDICYSFSGATMYEV